MSASCSNCLEQCITRAIVLHTLLAMKTKQCSVTIVTISVMNYFRPVRTSYIRYVHPHVCMSSVSTYMCDVSVSSTCHPGQHILQPYRFGIILKCFTQLALHLFCTSLELLWIVLKVNLCLVYLINFENEEFLLCGPPLYPHIFIVPAMQYSQAGMT